MAIWFKKDITINDFSHWNKNTLAEYLEIEFIYIGEDHLEARMPVTSRTQQPYGLLHGGASAVLAETVGSIASALVIDHDKYIALGIEISANHVRSVKSGFVNATCRSLNLGKTIHVWDIKMCDDNERLVCAAHLTVIIKKRPE